ncbi:hypothetical protein MC885_006321 [Smutsia gigantea]|nr:hypothetical protein MC885_006321 [Smutsia gigantea]
MTRDGEHPSVAKADQEYLARGQRLATEAHAVGETLHACGPRPRGVQADVCTVYPVEAGGRGFGAHGSPGRTQFHGVRNSSHLQAMRQASRSQGLFWAAVNR